MALLGPVVAAIVIFAFRFYTELVSTKTRMFRQDLDGLDQLALQVDDEHSKGVSGPLYDLNHVTVFPLSEDHVAARPLRAPAVVIVDAPEDDVIAPPRRLIRSSDDYDANKGVIVAVEAERAASDSEESWQSASDA